MKITLLTHSKEMDKRSNTGRLVVDVLGNGAEQICWDRMNPPAALLAEIEAGGVALIYPGAMDDGGDDFSAIRQVILIDGTWSQVLRHLQRDMQLLVVHCTFALVWYVLHIRSSMRNDYSLRSLDLYMCSLGQADGATYTMAPHSLHCSTRASNNKTQSLNFVEDRAFNDLR